MDTLRQRLLRDIAEIQTKPYPNIALNVRDSDITSACLVLTVEGYGHMHMTVNFPADYPLKPPRIQMNSAVKHPNIFGSYICSSILNTTEGYTSAYTLKSIAIQLLSFFSSDRVEQEGGGYSIDLVTYKSLQSYIADTYRCGKCHFGTPGFNPDSFNLRERVTSATSAEISISPFHAALAHDVAVWPTPQESAASHPRSPSGSTPSGSAPPGQGQIFGGNARRHRAKQNTESCAQAAVVAQAPPTPTTTASSSSSVVAMDLVQEPTQLRNIVDMRLPNEVVLAICNQLDTEDLMVLAQAWARIPRVMKAFDVIRTRELQCFCLKEEYLTVKLGVGVHVDPRTRSLESEFDLLSEESFHTHLIRRSTQGRPFEHWLPLPISNGHWRKVAADVPLSLTRLAASANIQNPTPAKVIFHFMNDIVVKLNQQASQFEVASLPYPIMRHESIQSTLTHASEKAIESYFHLFHLLVCLATANPAITRAAKTTLETFISGRTSKTDCPNLGHLLVAALISDVDISEEVIRAIIKETITRNVVWMLTSNPGLAYVEPSAVSEYRLHHTFQASKTSYRLLMFLNLFRKTAVGTSRKPLTQLRDEAFERHGAPPRGSAKGLADGIKRIHAVDRYPDFLAAMDIQTMPSKAQLNTYLHKCILDSVGKGYSRMPISQGEALTLRRLKEPNVEVAGGVFADYMDVRIMRGKDKSFFPQRGGGFQGRGRGRGRGGG